MIHANIENNIKNLRVMIVNFTNILYNLFKKDLNLKIENYKPTPVEETSEKEGPDMGIFENMLKELKT